MITILLLSHNNPAHLKRALSYYKQIEFKGRILIADSSRDEFRQQVRDIVAEAEERLFAPLLLEYDSKLFLSEKIACASQEIVTPYALLAGVDDFFSPQFMYEAMWFLKHNPDYLFVYGKAYGFTFTNNQIFCYYTGYFDKLRSFENQSPLERLRDFFPRYSACFNAVIRTAGLQKISMTTIHFARQLVTSENLYMMLVLLEGKAKYIPKPFHWRELSEASDGVTFGKAWLQDEKFKADFFEMERCLAQTLIEKQLSSLEQASIEAERLVNEFFAARYILTFPEESAAKNRLLRYVPEQLRKGIKTIKFRLKNMAINAGERYFHDETSPYGKEYQLIKECVVTSGISSYRADLLYVKQI